MRSTFLKSMILLIILFSVLLAKESTNAQSRLGVLKFEAFGLSDDSSLALNDTLCSSLFSTRLYKIYGYKKIQERINQTKQDISLQCIAPECALEIGKKLGLDKVAFGYIDKSDNNLEISLSIVNIKRNSVEKTINLKKDATNTTATSLIKNAVMRMHGIADSDKKHISEYPGQTIHKGKRLFWASSLCLGLGFVMAAVNGDLFSSGLSSEFDTLTMSNISSSIFQLPFFARPAALGDGYIAGADDAYGVIYNPAGMSWVKGPEVALGYQYGYSMLNNMAFSYADKASENVGFGECVLYSSDVDNLQKEIYFSSAYSYKLNRLYPLPWPASVGLTLKLGTIYSPESENATASQKTFYGGLDFGFLMVPNNNIRIAAVLSDAPGLRKVSNTTSDTRYMEYEPMRFNVGGVFQTSNISYNTFLIYQGQIPLHNDQHWLLSGGIEQQLFRVIKLRIGLKKQAITDTPWFITGGFGMAINNKSMAIKGFALDASYQYNTVEVLPSVNISLKFGF